MVLISNAARMEADVVATKKQAESASAAAKQMMEDSDNKVSAPCAGRGFLLRTHEDVVRVTVHTNTRHQKC